jgi:hypothetical protein
VTTSPSIDSRRWQINPLGRTKFLSHWAPPAAAHAGS